MPDETTKLEKTYNPTAIEQRLYAAWEDAGCFQPSKDGDPYTIVIPPPNVTGNLHMGHALNNTLQDILCRFERLRGRNVLWQVGTDHAGIATQMVVERQLAETGAPSRRDMGRPAFIERVWQWKQESGDTITQQLRRLGASCDWSRERFTMDEDLSKEVVRVFVQLHKEKLIYKDKRLVNWDPHFLTAISDLEVEQREQQGHLWHFKYPLEGGGHITVATTRPETMLGDTGIAVHPEDTRYTALIGKHAVLPLVGRRIPIVADSYADPTQGSGAVKITPAHDFNDFEVGKRCALPAINMLDQMAAVDVSGEAFAQMPARDDWQGLDRFTARKKVLAQMEALGLLEKTEEITHTVPYGDRSGQVIEPWLTDQWYVDAKTLAAPAIAAVEQGDTKFVPDNWKKTYFEWMNNIQPWCISRQLWWGHQIPAWYDEEGKVYVAETEAEAQSQAGAGVNITRDEDVLDTWFSSALWAFSTTDDLENRYPTQVLVTGFDIIFFWVARMMMMGLHFKGEVPFKEVYVHALVRDAKGAKMSKSKGNVIDPLQLIDKYGADALRFTMAAMASPGRDIKLAESRVEGYRNFGTKLWNAARFCEINNCFEAADFDPATATQPLTQWLVGEVVRAQADITRDLENYRFDLASARVYEFIRGSFCDWYVELAKPALHGDNAAEKAEVQAAARWGFENALRLLHPFMPFVTEELWQQTAKRDTFLMLTNWGNLNANLINEEGDSDIKWLIEMISEIRSIRATLNVPASAKIPFSAYPTSGEQLDKLIKFGGTINRLGRVVYSKTGKTDGGAMRNTPAGGSVFQDAPNAELQGCAQFVLDGVIYALKLEGIIDVSLERSRLEKKCTELGADVEKFSSKMNNKKFLDNATPEVIEKTRMSLSEEQNQLSRVREIFNNLL